LRHGQAGKYIGAGSSGMAEGVGWGGGVMVQIHIYREYRRQQCIQQVKAVWQEMQGSVV